MGIEGEQLVFDYLSRVGDLAHGTSMSAAERASLVNRLRTEIGRARSAQGGAEEPAAVRRILDRLGSPEEVVAAAAGRPDGGTGREPRVRERPAPEPAGAQGAGSQRPGPERPGPERAGPERPARDGGVPGSQAPPAPRSAAANAAYALWNLWSPQGGRPGRKPGDPPDAGGTGGTEGTGGPGAGPEAPGAARPAPGRPGPWAAPGQAGVGPARRGGPRTYWPDGDIGRFTGGIEIPEMLHPPLGVEAEPEPVPGAPGAGAGTDAGTDAGGAPADGGAVPQEDAQAARDTTGRRLLRALLLGKRAGGPIELLGVALLVAGTVVGSIVLLGLGWATAYWSPRLSRRVAQWASFGMPALVFGGYGLWLLARSGGWGGAPLEEGEAQEAWHAHWPWLLRAAALASAAFLLWRARRRVAKAAG